MRDKALVVALGALAALALMSGIVVHGPVARAADPPPDPVIAAVGDFACDPADSGYLGGLGNATRCQQLATSNALLADPTVGAVLGLGDFQYDCSDPADWVVSYNPTWGRLDARMDPVAGNHEYKRGTDLFGTTCPAGNSTAQSYFAHFGASAHPESSGHFSFDLGTWHLIGLNANCNASGVGGCAATSSQTKWLTADLAATKQRCVLAFWHQPLFTGRPKLGTSYRPWWNVLQAAGVDVVLNGHVHNYQRFASALPSGAASSSGITEYVVGTGGEGLMTVTATASPYPVASAVTFGYLRMTLQPAGWQAQFVDLHGQVLDTSSGTCH